MNKAGVPDLFVGITSWNSESFLGHCVQSILDTTSGLSRRIVVVDNESHDRSVDVAHQLGAEVYVRRCSQPDALAFLGNMSRSEYTLLIHADVIMLSDKWFPLCKSALVGPVVLVSPEDIGCGPYTRPFGVDRPESSFMLFRTRALRRSKTGQWKRKWGLPYPAKRFPFYGPHITHQLPTVLSKQGYEWRRMKVHMSVRTKDPVYQPSFCPDTWSDELSFLRYGLGNFYSIDGEITHYHNWYDRVRDDIEPDSRLTTSGDGRGFPLAYIKKYTENFIRDYTQGNLAVPDPSVPSREPRGL